MYSDKLDDDSVNTRALSSTRLAFQESKPRDQMGTWSSQLCGNWFSITQDSLRATGCMLPRRAGRTLHLGLVRPIRVPPIWLFQNSSARRPLRIL